MPINSYDKAKFWRFTDFNIAKERNWDPKKICYAIWWVEKGTSLRKKNHIEGFIAFKNPEKYETAKAVIGSKETLNIVPVVGKLVQTAMKTKKLITKTSGPWFFGSDPFVKAPVVKTEQKSLPLIVPNKSKLISKVIIPSKKEPIKNQKSQKSLNSTIKKKKVSTLLEKLIKKDEEMWEITDFMFHKIVDENLTKDEFTILHPYFDRKFNRLVKAIFRTKGRIARDSKLNKDWN